MIRRAPPACVIFDCDGVLVDSEPIHNQVMVECLAEIGVAITSAESMEQFMGRSLADCLAIVREMRGAPAPAGFLDRLHDRTTAAIQTVQAMPGIAAALAAITLPRCVASSSRPAAIERVLALTGLLHHFTGRIYSAQDVRRGKPHPDLFLHAAEQMGARPETCVVIEDSLPGIEGAQAAGMTVLGYGAGPHGARLAATGARVFTDLHDLPTLLDDLGR